MSDSDSNLDLLAEGQPNNRRMVNALANAMSPASYWAMRTYSSDDFTWAYYGGVINRVRYPNGTVDLSSFASEAAVYIEHTLLGVVSANTTGFTVGSVADYIVVTSADGVSSFEDVRDGAGGGGLGTGLTMTPISDTKIRVTYVGSDSVSRSFDMDLA